MKWKFSLFIPFWIPIITKKNLHTLPKKLTLLSNPLVLYKNKENQYIIHTDICPHQGASLSKGQLKDGILSCPYHGFQFCNGTFCNIPDPSSDSVKMFKSNIHLDLLEIKETQDFLFVKNMTANVPDVFYPPEENDKDFTGVDGTVLMDVPYQSVCENLLDMLHISYVHSFGSKKTPLPKKINFEWVNEYHGKTTFFYQPNPNSISGIIGKVKKVKVENEFILPTNTITRVYAGNTIKTVFTRSIPISENQTLLYWKIYRNFLTNTFFDNGIRSLMERTLKEDIDILKHTYPSKRRGKINTKYDKTINEFRKCHDKYSKIEFS